MFFVKDRFAGVEQRMFEQAEKDGRDTLIVIARDPGSAGVAYSSDLARRFAEKGFTVRIEVSNKSKVVRFGPFATVAELGFVDILRDEWTDAYISELEGFNGDGKGHDDQVDATSTAFWACRNSVELPSFSLPNFSNSSSDYNMSKALGL